MSKTQRVQAVYLLLFLAMCFAISSYFFHLAGTNLLPIGPDTYKVQAVVPTAVSLADAGDVRTAGVNVGRVSKLGERGGATVLELTLEKKHGPVYQDATVLIRAKSIAGENYVELKPGTPQAGELPNGGTLSIDHAEDATQIDELFSVFDSARRRDLQRALTGLGNGLNDGGADLNATLEAAAALPREGENATQALDAERNHVAALVDSFGRVTAALGARRDGIATFTRQAKAAAEAVAARDAQLRATLETLPPFLRQARATSTRLTGFANRSTPVIRDLRISTEELVPTVRDLLPAARDGQVMVRELRRFAQAAEPAIAHLKPFSDKATTFVPPLAGFLRQANPMFAYLAPYWREVATFFALDAASFQPTDATGHVARITLPVSRSNLAGVLTPEEDARLQELSSTFDTRGNNAYPSPGEAGGATRYTGEYPRLEADPPYIKESPK